jgi:hypothetical protein
MVGVRILLFVFGFSVWLAPRLCHAKDSQQLEFNRDIRPVLAANCFSCHGPDSAARQADLRLDRREVAIERLAIVPGKSNNSEAIRRIFSDDAAEQMPPPESHKVLTLEQKQLLKRWVEQGAEYQPHWSLIAPRRPALPKSSQAAWVRSAIDAFVLSALEQRGLSPAPEADRRTLVRRVSLDLTGLPPAPDIVEQFVADTSPDAYEKLVDRLLAMPQWGEHRARYWLDVARYADTHGLHKDNYREMWAYRDWVISAFNRNLPFDQFTIEQLAGDLLPFSTTDQQLNQLIASGFNRCNITTSEGGAIPEEYLVLYTRDRTETVSQVWLGLTAGCAVCHDHKFDPISQREFYETAAFFNNTTQQAMDGAVKDTPPIIFVPRQEDRISWLELPEKLANVQRKFHERRKLASEKFDEWARSPCVTSADVAVPDHNLLLHAPLEGGPASTLCVRIDGKIVKTSAVSLNWENEGPLAPRALKVASDTAIELPSEGDFEHGQSFSVGAWVKLPRTNTNGVIVARMDETPRMDGTSEQRGWDVCVEGNRVGMHLIHQLSNKDGIKVLAEKKLDVDRWHHVLVTYDGSSKANGIVVYYDGRPQITKAQFDSLTSSIRTAVSLKLAQRNKNERMKGLGLQDVRIYGMSLSGREAFDLARGPRAAILAATTTSQRSDAQREELFEWWLSKLDSSGAELRAAEIALQEQKTAIRLRGSVTHVMRERDQPAVAYVLERGEYTKASGNPLQPNTPDMLPEMPGGLPRNRLGFAKWLFLREHPLTARVTVNRFWQEVFGAGLVRTSGDFGISGELPVHQELLDWLAVEFRESGWDTKRLVRLLVLSSTYRQSAAITPDKLDRDPQNRLLSRGPRFRMDAEMIRDYALAASGLLIYKIGGPSVKPYQPTGVWENVAMFESNTRQYVQDHGENLYRRSLYTFWKRSAPPASMDIFNAPSREVCSVRRERTNTPLQALATLNDTQFVEAARHLAQNAIKAAKNTDGRLQWLAERLLARHWESEELDIAKSSLTELQSLFAGQPEAATRLISVGESKADRTISSAVLAAWTMLVNEMMNLDEVLNK